MDPTSDPTSEPTYEPTFDPTSDPVPDPTSYPTIEPTRMPTRFPTETFESNSFLKIVCIENETYFDEIYTLNLTQTNDYYFGSDDTLEINNITIPAQNQSGNPDGTICYLRIFLSNNDYWGYRQNTTCTLDYTIELNEDNDDNKNIEITQLSFYNFFVVNQRYTTAWNNEFISNTQFQFGAFPICQTVNNMSNEDILFARNLDVQGFFNQENQEIEQILGQFDTTTSASNTSLGEQVTSTTGFFPYEFSVESNQINDTSTLVVNPGQTCIYDEALPTYDYNGSVISNGGIDYYLVINADTYNMSENAGDIVINLNVNIEIEQECQEFFVEDENGVEMGMILLIILSLLFGWMALCCCLVYCRVDGGDEAAAVLIAESSQKTGGGDNNSGNKGGNGQGNNEPEIEKQRNEFVVTEKDHKQMLEMMRRQSMSTGLEAD